jgi:hypothetical protein
VIDLVGVTIPRAGHQQHIDDEVRDWLGAAYAAAS